MTFRQDMTNRCWSTMARARLAARDLCDHGIIAPSTRDSFMREADNVMRACDAALLEMKAEELKQ